MALVKVSENGELLEHRVYPGASYLIKPTFDRFVRYYNYPLPRDSQGNIVCQQGTFASRLPLRLQRRRHL